MEKTRLKKCPGSPSIPDKYTLTDDAVWNVTGTSLISSLTIEDDASVVIPEDVTLTVNGIEYSGCTLTSEDI